MNLTWTPQERRFREEVRAFAEAKLPEDIRGKVLLHQRLERDDYVRWHNILADHGWGAPSWCTASCSRSTRRSSVSGRSRPRRCRSWRRSSPPRRGPWCGSGPSATDHRLPGAPA